MKRKTYRQLGLVSFSVAVSIMVGCQQPTPTGANATDSTVKNPTAPGAKPQAPNATTGTTGNPVDTAQVNQAVGTGDDLSKQPAVHITAKDGGVYTSPDGLLTATIPPGALSADADVRFLRVDTSKLQNSDVHLNGIRYQMDLGGAVIAPGTKVTVTSKADDRMIGELKSMYADYTPERYSLSKDAKGNWNITMSTSGPVASLPDGAKASGLEGPTRGQMFEGSVPLPAADGGAFNKGARIEAFCNYAPPPLPAHYGPTSCEVQWNSDDPLINSTAAAGIGLPGQPGYSAKVEVVFSSDLVTSQQGNEYTFQANNGAPAMPPLKVDQYGNLLPPYTLNGAGLINPPNAALSPADQTLLATWIAQNPTLWNQEQLAAKVALDNNRNLYARGLFTPDTANPDIPASPAITEHFLDGSNNAYFGYNGVGNFAPLHAINNPHPIQLYPGFQAIPPGPDTILSNIAFQNSNTATYTASGHSCQSQSNCTGPYVSVNDHDPIIEPLNYANADGIPDGLGVGGNVFTTASGTATIQALQSTDTTHTAGGGTSGGLVNFFVFCSPHIYDNLGPGSGQAYYDTIPDSRGSLPGLNGPAKMDTAYGPRPVFRLQKNSPCIQIALNNTTDIAVGSVGSQGGTLDIEGTATDLAGNNPRPIVLTLALEGAYSAPMTVGSDGGVPVTKLSMLPFDNTTPQVLSLYVQMPDDNPGLVTITKMYSDSLDLTGKPQDLSTLKTVSVQRNGVYPRSVNLVLNAAK